LYEAAEIDGCTPIKKIRYITLPLIVPIVITMVILSLGGIMRSDFGLFFYITHDSPMLYTKTDVLDTYIYRAMRQTGDFSGSTAIGLIQSVVGFILVIITNKLAKKIDDSTSLF
jgi:putative aldouronate transport system permease protein